MLPVTIGFCRQPKKGKTMKKLLMMIFMELALCSHVLYADEQGGTTSFWDVLKRKLESLTPEKKAVVTTTTATGGVRGAPMASEELYWKGETMPKTIDAEELDAFKRAVALFDSGDKPQAKAAFSEFIRKYPDSLLRRDADQALVLSTP
jgi:TolA-binding protein